MSKWRKLKGSSFDPGLGFLKSFGLTVEGLEKLILLVEKTEADPALKRLQKLLDKEKRNLNG